MAPVMASAENCTFNHGMVDKYYGFETTESTQLESTLKNTIYVTLYDANSYSVTGASGNSTYYEVRSYSLRGHKGNHLVKYYVNGSLAHTATAPWPFDFT